MLDETPDKVGQNVHAVADMVVDGHTCHLSTYALQYMKHETFEFVIRGTAPQEHILDEEDVLRQARRLFAAKATTEDARGLTVDKFQGVRQPGSPPELVKDPNCVTLHDRALKDKRGTCTISNLTALASIKRAGAECTWFKQGT